MENLQKGMPVWVKFGKKQRIAGTVLEWAWASQGDYQWVGVELELELENKLVPGQVLRSVYQKTVQSYRLTHRTVNPDLTVDPEK
jgi:hypothetical protein